MSAANTIDFSGLPLFNRIDARDCSLLFDCLGCRIRRYKKDDYIRMDGEMNSTVGTVLEGSVLTYTEDIWGKRTLISFITEGDVFGENIAFMGNGMEKPDLVYKSASSTLILFIPAGRITHPCKNACTFHHLLTQNMFALISAKNRSLMKKIDVISRGSVREKILAYLSMEALRSGSSTFRIPLRRSEMAEYLCINRSAMTRELASLKKEGIIDYDKNLFIIPSPEEPL